MKRYFAIGASGLLFVAYSTLRAWAKESEYVTLKGEELSHLPILLTIGGALAGYLITYFYNLRLENRRAQLKYTTDQIQYLYGPLFSLCYTSGPALYALSAIHPRENTHAFSEEESARCRLWMKEVFMPLNVEMEKTIKNNAHLIEDEEMPKSFKELLAHVQGWKIVCKKWDDKDFSENSSCVAFPQDLHPYVANTYAKLKRRQSKLSSSLF